MPELPEVETIVGELITAPLIGQKIASAKVFWPRTIETPEAPTFCQQIQSQTIQRITRRGKYILFTLTRQTLIVHLRMTGKFCITRDPAPRLHERVRLQLVDGRILHYIDQRKFGKWGLYKNVEERLQSLGIEPLSEAFTLEILTQLAHTHPQRMKAFLLDQRHIAGLGNIYVDEALWMAQIHPETHATQLSATQLQALFHAIPAVLRSGLANKGTSLGAHRSNYARLGGQQGINQDTLNVFRRQGEPCPRCKALIVKTIVAQRGTHLCPHCQKI